MSIVNNAGASAANPYAFLNGSAASGGSASSSSASGSSGSGSASSGVLNQNEFLKLMIAQIKNQDPTQPMSSTQFMGQLAQFSTVSGIQNLQSTVSSMASNLGPSRLAQASNLINHQVLVASNSAYLPSGGNLTGALSLPNGATSATVNIENGAGQVVRQLKLGAQQPGNAAFSWNGLSDQGTQLPPGNYTVKATASVGGSNVAPTVLTGAKVTGISMGASGNSINLNLAGLGTVALSKVQSIN